MPELHFIGKEFVYNHHLTVPYRPLVAHPEKGIGEGSLDDNLIIHGDNLHALKALLPRYAGKVDCIFIDPPYNTGNEGWCYNDNVSSPLLKEWLSGNPINTEDMLRHDKWCCMMWPRLKLLYELLADNGSLWISIDDIEVSRIREILDELFTVGGFVAQFCWKARASEDTRAISGVSTDHEYLLCYRKSGDRLRGSQKDLTKFANPDDDPRGPWRSADLTGLATKEQRPNLHYELVDPKSGFGYGCPPKGWRYEKRVMETKIAEDRILWPSNRDGRPRHKLFLLEMTNDTKNVSSVITGPTTGDGTRELRDVLGIGAFDFPKPTEIVSFVLSQAANENALVLDSFAGSGTTAHAVLKANYLDGGNRRFILVECEDYADTLTAERVRRVIKGYPYHGTQKETLFEQKLNLANLKKADQLLQEATNAVTFHEGSYGKVETKVEDGVLRVVGIRNVEETAPGLGGTFTYCTLGEPIDLDKILQGESMPSFENMASWLVHTAFGTTAPSTADHRGEGIGEWYVGETDGYHVWLIYRPEKAFLQSKESALTLETAETFSNTKPDKPSLVFAPSKYVGKKYLDALTPRVEYAPLPFALYRLERS